ncbi:terminase family protein [Erythrobacter sp.]|uniref:DNA-packaging protein n=1 Tax=Erythrobacter sp. TaxID=1042 RepID=UPI001425BD98|nr:terminase family protein [Erythrobacter sp.]QIQ87706.1 MAG: DNA-packaging protein [Erythrobacter sp.]
MTEPLECLAHAAPQRTVELADRLTAAERSEFAYHWRLFARPAQLAPPGDWRVWLVMAGRGFGKTRAGAEWVRAVAEEHPQARIALISASLEEARAVMVEGESGILACCPPDRRPLFEPSLRRLRFANGAQARLYSALEPEALRGPQHSHAWCDEIGKWPVSHQRATRCWDNLLMGLRLGREQRIAVTTTPRPVPLVERLLEQEKDGATVVTRGSTHDNAANLPERFLKAIEAEFAGSQLARQEIGGEMVRDIDGALWQRTLLDAVRESGDCPAHGRVVVAVDPPASAEGDECGIIVAALGTDGLSRVLADCSIGNATPDRWAAAVAAAAEGWEADRVVAEANQGGSMVESVLRAADRALPIKLVHASRGKVARAEPVAALYGAGRVRHRGMFARLEDQLCGLMLGGEYVGPGRSPDRADALVWALTELMLTRAARPRVSQI